MRKNSPPVFRPVHYEDNDGDLQPYDQSENYFRFMSAPNLIEPTNNHCEQQIRHCVIDRRITQGTRSDVGQTLQPNVCGASPPPAPNKATASSPSSTKASPPTSRATLAPPYSARKP